MVFFYKSNPMKKVNILVSFLLIIGFQACNTSNQKDQVLNQIEEMRKEVAPDKRVAIWDLQYENGTLSGETDQIEALNQILASLERKEFYEKYPCPKSVRYNPEQNKDPLFNQKKLAALKSLENKKALYTSLYPDSQRLSISFMFGSTIPLQYLSHGQTEGFKPSSSSPKESKVETV